MNPVLAQVTELDDASAAAAPLRPFDVRLRREMAHRRLAASMMLRFVRVAGLNVCDALMLLLAVVATATALPGIRDYTTIIVAVGLLSLNAMSAYGTSATRSDPRRLLWGVLLSQLILASLVIFPPRLALGGASVATLGAFSVATLLLGRGVMSVLARQVKVRGLGLRRAVIIGGLDEVTFAIERLRSDPGIGHQSIEGHLVPDGMSDPTAMGALSELAKILDERDVQEVIVATALPAATMRRVANVCFAHGAALLTIPAVTGWGECRVEALRTRAGSMIRLHPARLELPKLLLKRGFDLVIASLMLVLGLPLIALIAVAIKLDSRGPVFYRAHRVGLGGQLFRMWKFRSMRCDAADREHELAHLNLYSNGTFKVRNDPRVTRVGRILRRTSLDELPQLFNVLTGEMSLVGPRPALVSDLQRYQPHHFERLSVIPGMTGAWQVGGRNLITDFDVIFRMDVSYIQRWSLWLDVKIMIRTLKVVVTGEGAF